MERQRRCALVAPAATSYAANRLDVFAKGENDPPMAEIVGWKQLGPVEGSSEGNEGVKSKGRVAQSTIYFKKIVPGVRRRGKGVFPS